MVLKLGMAALVVALWELMTRVGRSVCVEGSMVLEL
jgi:hypothetical protein